MGSSVGETVLQRDYGLRTRCVVAGSLIDQEKTPFALLWPLLYSGS